MKADGSVVVYDWDGNGNMIAKTEGNQTTQFEYDYDSRLVRIVYANGSVVRFGYDGLGRRVWRQDSVSLRNFFYDGDRIIAEREGSSWVVRYLLGLRPSGFVANGQVRVYHADRIGSVRWVTDGGQNILVSYVYEGFGKIVGQNGWGGGPYQFCGLWGYRNDWDGGLMHVGARYYEFETGRWVQKDPHIRDTFHPQTLNRYVYVVNSSVNMIDPKGLQTITDILALLAVILTRRPLHEHHEHGKNVTSPPPVVGPPPRDWQDPRLEKNNPSIPEEGSRACCFRDTYHPLRDRSFLRNNHLPARRTAHRSFHSHR